jgi:hypothetical protein
MVSTDFSQKGNYEDKVLSLLMAGVWTLLDCFRLGRGVERQRPKTSTTRLINLFNFHTL